MADYLSITDAERAEMMKLLGITKVSELYSDLPRELRRKKFALSDGRSQQETYAALAELAAKNATYRSIFRGAGSYHHYIPSAVKSIVSREEFLTSYTPYQPEISQGLLQATFEFQTMMCALTGMDVATASHYSGATAAAEACVMCADRSRPVVTFDNIDPDTLETLGTYLKARGIELKVLHAGDGSAQYPSGTGAGAVYFESPNYYGILEDVNGLTSAAKAEGASAMVRHRTAAQSASFRFISALSFLLHGHAAHFGSVLLRNPILALAESLIQLHPVGVQNGLVEGLFEFRGAGETDVPIFAFDLAAGHGDEGAVSALLHLDPADGEAPVQVDRGVCQDGALDAGTVDLHIDLHGQLLKIGVLMVDSLFHRSLLPFSFFSRSRVWRAIRSYSQGSTSRER